MPLAQSLTLQLVSYDIRNEEADDFKIALDDNHIIVVTVRFFDRWNREAKSDRKLFSPNAPCVGENLIRLTAFASILVTSKKLERSTAVWQTPEVFRWK